MMRPVFFGERRIVLAALLAIGGLGASCARGAPQTASHSDVTSMTVLSPGDLEFALPREFCYPGSRVGDTVTTQVSRSKLGEEGGLVGRFPDVSIPNGLRAFLRVDRIGSATGRKSMQIDFVVDSFVLAEQRAVAPLRVAGYESEGAFGREIKPGVMQQCYNQSLHAFSNSDIVLRRR